MHVERDGQGQGDSAIRPAVMYRWHSKPETGRERQSIPGCFTRSRNAGTVVLLSVVAFRTPSSQNGVESGHPGKRATLCFLPRLPETRVARFDMCRIGPPISRAGGPAR